MPTPISPGGNNIDGPPEIDHSLSTWATSMQEALANIDIEEKERDYEPAGGRRKRRRKSRRKSRKKKRKSRKGKKKRKTRRKKKSRRRRR